MKSIREMKMRRYMRDDYNDISMWYEARNLKPIPFKYVPKIGYIIEEIACGYLVRADNGTAYLEGFITNPKSDKQQRREAIDLIAKKLIKEAQELGYTQIFAFTSHPTIVEAAQNNEFKQIGQYMAFLRGVE